MTAKQATVPFVFYPHIIEDRGAASETTMQRMAEVAESLGTFFAARRLAPAGITLKGSYEAIAIDVGGQPLKDYLDAINSSAAFRTSKAEFDKGNIEHVKSGFAIVLHANAEKF